MFPYSIPSFNFLASTYPSTQRKVVPGNSYHIGILGDNFIKVIISAMSNPSYLHNLMI
jgi:hypothetical protein